MVSVSSVQTLHIEHGVNSVLTPGGPLGMFHPMILASLFLLCPCILCQAGDRNAETHACGSFIHAATLSQVSAVGQAEGRPWEAGVSPFPSWFPLSKIIGDRFSPPGSPLPSSVRLSLSPQASQRVYSWE